jgi:hypothetical protein
MRPTGLRAHLTAVWATLRPQQAEAAKLDATIAASQKELGYGG